MNKKGAISVAILVGFLILAPLISYVYLKQGYKFRKEALTELEPKGKVEAFKVQIDSTLTLSDDDIKGKVSVLSYIENTPENWAYLTAIYHQYKNRREFNMWTFASKVSVVDSIQGLPGWSHIEMPASAYRAFIDSSMPEKDAPTFHHILLDTTPELRRVYGTSPAEKRKLIEHIVIVLPRTKDSDIIYEVPEEGK